MKIRTGALAAVAALTFVLGSAAVLGSATPAVAASPAPVDLGAARAAVTARIDGRLHTLDALKVAVTGATTLRGTHRGTLSNLISADVTGLTALRAKVAADSTAADLRADERSMVQDYRVYLLVVPKVRYTIATDAELAAIDRLRTVHDTLAAAVAKDKAAGRDVSQQEAELADLAAQLDAGGSALAGHLDALLAQAPGPDAAAIAAVVAPARTAVRTARVDLGKAVADAKRVRDQLR